MSVKQSTPTKRKAGKSRMKKPKYGCHINENGVEVDDWSGLPPQPFTQLDSSPKGYKKAAASPKAKKPKKK